MRPAAARPPVPGRDGPGLRLAAVRATAALGLLASAVLAPRLWLGAAPFAPLALWGEAAPPPMVLAAHHAALLVALALAAAPRVGGRAAWAALVLLAARAPWDRALWQPFLLECGFLLLVAVAWRVEPGREPAEQRESALDAARLALVLLYAWSGTAKMTALFARAVFPDMVRAVWAGAPAGWLEPAGRLAAPLEAAAGLALLAPRLRRPAVLFLAAMHGFILLAIGPAGQNYNRVVWPWNVASAALLVALFCNERGAGVRRIVWRSRSRLRPVALLAFGLLPGLSWVGLYPVYLSFRLYSDQFPSALLWVSPAVAARLPPELRREIAPDPDPRWAGRFLVAHAAERALGAFLPTEPANYARVARRICALADRPDAVRLIQVSVPDRRTGAVRSRSYYCDELGP